MDLQTKGRTPAAAHSSGPLPSTPGWLTKADLPDGWRTCSCQAAQSLPRTARPSDTQATWCLPLSSGGLPSPMGCGRDRALPAQGLGSQGPSVVGWHPAQEAPWSPRGCRPQRASLATHGPGAWVPPGVAPTTELPSSIHPDEQDLLKTTDQDGQWVCMWEEVQRATARTGW